MNFFCSSRGHRHNILSDSIAKYMVKINEGYHEDPVRAFFRLHVAELGKLIPYVSDEASAFVNSSRATSTQDVAAILSEANGAILVYIFYVCTDFI
jgi:nuclear pore complex protein Nup133